MTETKSYVWVFHGARASFASAVFSSLEKAEAWINAHKLEGMLTRYPLDISAYDDAIEQGYFKPKKDFQKSPAFIGKFTHAGMEHYHYDNEESE